ncbi:uncharacterized protein LOC144577223 [Callithrix jacchus]
MSPVHRSQGQRRNRHSSRSGGVSSDGGAVRASGVQGCLWRQRGPRVSDVSGATPASTVRRRRPRRGMHRRRGRRVGYVGSAVSWSGASTAGLAVRRLPSRSQGQCRRWRDSRLDCVSGIGGAIRAGGVGGGVLWRQRGRRVSDVSGAIPASMVRRRRVRRVQNVGDAVSWSGASMARLAVRRLPSRAKGQWHRRRGMLVGDIRAAVIGLAVGSPALTASARSAARWWRPRNGHYVGGVRAAVCIVGVSGMLGMFAARSASATRRRHPRRCGGVAGAGGISGAVGTSGV